MLYAHGTFATGWRERHVKVPENMSVYFYVLHGVASSDGSASAVVRSDAPEKNTTQRFGAPDPNETEEEKWAKTFLLWGKASATSIAGPGSLIWDYELSYNEKFTRMIRELNMTGSRDLLTLDCPDGPKRKGTKMHLSKLFALIEVFKYEKFHYLPCRSPNTGIDYNPKSVDPTKPQKSIA